MLNPGQQPCCEVILAACRLFNLEVYVYHGMKMPVVYKCSKSSSDSLIIHLQCISLIHYNPAYRKKSKCDSDFDQDERYLNVCCDDMPGLEFDSSPSGDTEIVTEYDIDFNYELKLKPSLKLPGVSCLHRADRNNNVIADTCDSSDSLCCLIDTGAQVSILSETAFRTCAAINRKLSLLDCTSRLRGLKNERTTIVGYCNVDLSLFFPDIQKSLPFAIVKDCSIPCCVILGSNFLVQHDITLDCSKNKLLIGNSNSIIDCSLNVVQYKSAWLPHINFSEFVGELNESSFTDSDISEGADIHAVDVDTNDTTVSVPRFIVEPDALHSMQEANYAIRNLKRIVSKSILPKNWRIPSLNKFKRHYKNLKVVQNLLVKSNSSMSPVVVSFPFMVEVIHKVHGQLSHVGRHKLLSLISSHFWHPAMDAIARKICACCKHCQLFKSDNQTKSPPTLKIQSSRPFDLVAVDLLQFPKSRNGNVAMLVLIDHYSKWLAVAPIRDKRSMTVAMAFEHKILPLLPRIPNRLLSDNGMEFKGLEFERVLEEYKIKHVYSTPYMPSSNGCVERVNRTVLQLLNGIQIRQNEWDMHLSRVVITYNNSVHSQLNLSPSACILSRAHNCNATLPVTTELVETWCEGHPNFCPFKINQKVLKKIVKVGNRLENKLGQKFEGPYLIQKVHSKKLTYEVCAIDDFQTCFKVHYRQLRPFKVLPYSIARYIDKECPLSNKDSDINDDSVSIGSEPGHVIYESDFTDLEDVELLSEKDDEPDQVLSEITQTINSRKLNLSQFPCSESTSKVNMDAFCPIVQSTPQPSGITIDSILEYNELNLSLLMSLEESLGHQENLLDRALHLTTTDLLTTGVQSCNKVPAVNIEDSLYRKQNSSSDYLLAVDKDKPIEQGTTEQASNSCSRNVEADCGNHLNVQQCVNDNSYSNTKIVINTTENEINESNPQYNNDTVMTLHKDSLASTTDAGVLPGDSPMSQALLSSHSQSEMCGQKGFEGFALNDNSRSKVLLSDMRAIVVESRKRVEQGRRRSREFRLEALRNLSRLHLSVSGVTDHSVGEAEDVLTELPQSTPRRVLRSHGSVKDLPNVQEKTIEYCKHHNIS